MVEHWTLTPSVARSNRAASVYNPAWQIGNATDC